MQLIHDQEVGPSALFCAIKHRDAVRVQRQRNNRDVLWQQGFNFQEKCPVFCTVDIVVNVTALPKILFVENLDGFSWMNFLWLNLMLKIIDSNCVIYGHLPSSTLRSCSFRGPWTNDREVEVGTLQSYFHSANINFDGLLLIRYQSSGHFWSCSVDW